MKKLIYYCNLSLSSSLYPFHLFHSSFLNYYTTRIHSFDKNSVVSSSIHIHTTAQYTSKVINLHQIARRRKSPLAPIWRELMDRMYTSQYFFMLSARVATAQAAPSHPPAESAVIDAPNVVSYAGAPANGEYPDEVADNGGWESDAPTYDTAVSLHPDLNPKLT
jgi:hypothetical protein